MNKDILIIGESCIDVFTYCDCQRLCPDIPVPALTVVKTKENWGMAKNVERNLVSLNQQCDIYTNINYEEFTKVRYVHSSTNHMFIRIDKNGIMPSAPINAILADLSKYKLIVISDYNKGYLSEADIENICYHHPLVFLDTKKELDRWADRAAFIKINNYEYIRSQKNLTPILSDKIIRTIGADGCIYKDKIYPVPEKVEVKDTSGCGDTFLSGLVTMYLATSNVEKSIDFANLCASSVAKHVGVTVPSFEVEKYYS